MKLGRREFLKGLGWSLITPAVVKILKQEPEPAPEPEETIQEMAEREAEKNFFGEDVIWGTHSCFYVETDWGCGESYSVLGMPIGNRREFDCST